MRAYAFADDTHSGSVPLAFETVFDKAGDADVWLVKYNRDRDMSYADLEADYIATPVLRLSRPGMSMVVIRRKFLSTRRLRSVPIICYPT